MITINKHTIVNKYNINNTKQQYTKGVDDAGVLLHQHPAGFSDGLPHATLAVSLHQAGWPIARAQLGNLASQDFGIFLRISCGSLVEACGD